MEHASIYIGGGGKGVKLGEGKKVDFGQGSIIYLRPTFGQRGDPRMVNMGSHVAPVEEVAPKQLFDSPGESPEKSPEESPEGGGIAIAVPVSMGNKKDPPTSAPTESPTVDPPGEAPKFRSPEQVIHVPVTAKGEIVARPIQSVEEGSKTD